MLIKFLLLSDIRIGYYYKLITFKESIRYIDVQLRQTDNGNVYETNRLGKLLSIIQTGRSYDPDILLTFKLDSGEVIEYEPHFGSVEAFIEYEPDTEEYSKIRTQKRNSIIHNEIISNDWALRPENVVATQCIDLSNWAEGNMQKT